MLHSKLFLKTKKEAPSDEVAKNAILLDRANFIYKEMAGVYSYLPMGLKVLNKIENLIRKQMDTIGNEITMSSLAPKELWEKTGRLEEVDVLFKASAANENSKNKSSNEYVLNSTHEELITPIALEFGKSYKDFPFAYYQIQTKFRNEPRAKSGLLRGREFRMKDLYSFHLTQEDFEDYYEKAKVAYMNFFKEVGLGESTFITSASGGDFTDKLSHEFQVVCDAGEDIIYLNKNSGTAYNKEVLEIELKNNNLKVEDLEELKACEVGNIFTLEDRFTKSFNFQYTNVDNQKNVVPHMGCYGIGSSRIMGVLVEKFGDEKGLVWPKAVAPFDIEIVSLHKEKNDKVYEVSKNVYQMLNRPPLTPPYQGGEEYSKKYEVLWDDRELSAGVKLNDADLYGIPMQIIIGTKNLEENLVEIKLRHTGEVVKVKVEDLEKELMSLWQKVF